MPVYVYKCPKCGSQVELQRSVADHDRSHPMCVAEGCDGQQTMNLQIQKSSFILRGDGWTSHGE
jgi:putative FmdB family regulatory protein